MTLDDLTASLDALGVKITAVDGKLRVDAPSGVLTDDLRAALKEHKAGLLAQLKGDRVPSKPSVPSGSEMNPQSDAPGTTGEVLGERIRIPLDALVYGDWLAQHKLKIVGGTPDLGGRPWQPTLYLTDDE